MITPPATLGFIGLGVMGRSMAQNLMQAGYSLVVHTRTPDKAKPLLDAGAIWADSVAELASDVQAVITIVGYPSDVRDVYLSTNGLISSAKPGAILIDMTTSEPSLAMEIAAEASARELSTLDAPVSGGDIGAQNGTLSIMIGGEADTVQQASPILKAMGSTLVHQGPAGSGQHTKMCNQITIASTMVGIMESLIYAVKSGLDPETVLQSIGSGAAQSWSLTNLQPRVIQNDFAPGFYICHFLKDIRIALDEAAKLDLNLPGLKLAETRYQQCIDLGLADEGTQALYKTYT